MFTLGTLLGFIAIAVAVILPGIGSSIGVSYVGRAGTGVITEDPDKFTQVLILQAVPATQGLYGFITGLLIMMRVGVLGGSITSLSTSVGLSLLYSALPIAFVGCASAIYQGKVAAASVNIIAKKPEELVKGIVFAAMVETFAIFSLLVSILMIFSIQV